MPLLRPSPSPAVAARVAALLGRSTGEVAAPGGWVPDQPELAAARVAAPLPDPAVEVSRATRVEVPAELPKQPTPAEGRRTRVEGPAPVEPATVRGLLASGRLDPGHRGALALGAVGVVASLLAAFVLLRGRPSEQPLTAPPVVGSVVSTAGPEVVVDVAGKVRRPGLVRLPVGARVDDALKAAGGVLPGASTSLLNLARKLMDGEQVLVGVEGAVAAGSTAGGLLDLNVATAQDLDGLPGIGPVLADRIVEWRTEHGRFASVDQLREVSGIGESKYQSLKSKVRV